MTTTVRQEFLRIHKAAEFQRVTTEYRMKVLRDASAAETSAIARSLNITSEQRHNDLSLIASAQKYGLGVVTADRSQYRAALLVQPALPRVEYRIFHGSPIQRVQATAKARSIEAQLRPNLTLGPRVR